MVAKSKSLAQRFAPPPAPVLAGRWELVHFTRDDVEALIQQGRIPEDATTELLSGMIALKDRAAAGDAVTSIGKAHRYVVERLSDLRSKINSPDRHVESQQPLVCQEDHVPEPDFAVLRGTLGSYEDLATAADAFCVVEVADSSYERDTGLKRMRYAMAGIPQYVVIDLRNGTAEVFTNPDVNTREFGSREVVNADQIFSLHISDADEQLVVPLAELLPRR